MSFFGKFLSRLCILFSVATIAAVLFAFGVTIYFNAPNKHHNEDKKFVIERGLTFRQVVEKLHQEKIIPNINSFLYLSQIVKGYNPTVRYGEYFFEKNTSYYKIMHKIVRGYVSFRKITIAEGLSINSALEIINDSYGLIGSLPNDIREGSILPETYFNESLNDF